MNAKAITPPPPPKNKEFLPERQVQAADNMKRKKEVMMSFNMPTDWHVRFKTTAVMKGLSMKDLLIEVFDEWEKNNK